MNKFLCTLTVLLSFAYHSGRAMTRASFPIRASFYAKHFEGRRMANGKIYHADVISAASLKYPLGTSIRVTNVRTGKSIVITVTDRGPWHTRFSLDLSPAAFHALGFNTKAGWGWVTVQKVDA